MSPRLRLLCRTIGVLLAVIALLAAVPASGAEYGKKVIVRDIAKTTVTDDGKPIRYPCTGTPEVTARIVELPAGAQTGWHYHPIPVYAYVMRGTLEVERPNGKVIVYHQGDAIVEAVDSPHNARTMGREPVELVVFYTGVKGTAMTVTSPRTNGPGAR